MTVEKTDWETRSDIEKADNSVKGELSEMLSLKTRVVAYAQQACNNTNIVFSCRKRMASGSSKGNMNSEQISQDLNPQPNKKTKFTGITTGEGVWDPKMSKFASKIG